jgi:flagellar hook-associated protein 3 FlgL
MISNLDAASEAFLANVGRVQQSLAEASQQVSSGKKISTPSDAPDQIAPLLQLRSSLQRNTQITANLGLSQADAGAADSALSSAIQLMDSAVTLAGQASSSVLEDTARAGIADQIQSIQDRMVALANTTSRGQYIFSGDQGQSPAYQLDPDNTFGNGVTQIATATSARQVEDPAGGSFPAAKTAQDIFDARNPDGTCASDNVFASLNNLRLAIAGAANGDTSGIEGAIGSLKLASQSLNTSQAFYGNVETRIQDAQTYAGNRDTQLKAQISNLEDADVASAALELTQGSTELSAAFQSQAKMPTKSLFDYLG